MSKQINPNTAQTHLNMIRVWALAIAKDTGKWAETMQDFDRYAKEGVDAIKFLLSTVEEQRGTIDRLEHELAAARAVTAAKQSTQEEY